LVSHIEEHRLGVFENRVLRKISGTKNDKTTGDWRSPHNEEFYNLYSSPNITQVYQSRRMRWAGHVARMRGKGEVYTRRPLGKLGVSKFLPLHSYSETTE
jgi:hypothetical protein